MKCDHCGTEISNLEAAFCPKCGKAVLPDVSFPCKAWPEWTLDPKPLGKGSYGTVFKAVRRVRNVESVAAIKVISIPTDSSVLDVLRSEGMTEAETKAYLQGVVDEFIGEVQMMEVLKGVPNIVGIEDYEVVERDGEVGWDIYIRMELLTPFGAYTAGKTLTEKKVAKLGCDICTALELCGKRNIIHRDIKPENIFINDFGYFKLGDFGIARKLENMTCGLSQKGTFNYIAPEVVTGNQYDARVDIYSLGIVLYRLLNGNRLPFVSSEQFLSANERRQAVDRRIQGEQLPPPCDASPAMAEVILKACEYDPAKRFSSAGEFKKALQKAVIGAYAPAAPVDKTVSVRKTPAAPAEKPAAAVELPKAAVKTAPQAPPAKEIEKTTAVRRAPAAAIAGRNASSTPDTAYKSKKWIWLVVFLAVFIILLLLLLRSCGLSEKDTASTLPSTAQTNSPEWSVWLDILPDGITPEQYEIEQQMLYSRRTLETTVSTELTTMLGWELYDTVESDDTGYSNWSDWAADEISPAGGREIETQTQYRYREKETTTSTDSTMPGWELYDTTEAWGEYGNWSNWSTSAVKASESQKIETKTQYRYRNITYSTAYSNWSTWSEWQDNSVSKTDLCEVEVRTLYRYYCFQCQSCGAHQPFWGYNYPCKGCGSVISKDGWTIKWSTIPYTQCNPMAYSYTPIKMYTTSLGDGEVWIFGVANMYDTAPGTQDEGKYDIIIESEYRYRTRTTYEKSSYGSWSNWGDTAYSASSARDVENRAVYRYCTREKILTNHYYKWEDWSDWELSAANASDSTQVEERTVHRYRDVVHNTTYYFRRWNEWTDYSPIKMTPDETTEVKTKVQYRYKAKAS